MLNVIFAISAAIVLLSILYVGWQATKPMEGMILGVTLPPERQDDTSVKKLAARYTNRLLWLTGGLVLLGAPVFLLTRRMSLTLIAFFVWI